MSKKYSGKSTFEIFVEECANEMRKANDKMNNQNEETSSDTSEEKAEIDVENTLEVIDEMFSSLPELNIQFIKDKKNFISEKIHEIRELAAGYTINPEAFMNDSIALKAFENKSSEVINIMQTYVVEFNKMKDAATLKTIEYGYDEVSSTFIDQYMEIEQTYEDIGDGLDEIKVLMERYKELDALVSSLPVELQKRFEKYLLEERMYIFWTLSCIDSDLEDYQ